MKSVLSLGFFWNQFGYFIAEKLNTDGFWILLGQMQLFALPAAPSGWRLSAVDSSWAGCEPSGRADEINMRSAVVLRTMEGGDQALGSHEEEEWAGEEAASGSCLGCSWDLRTGSKHWKAHLQSDSSELRLGSQGCSSEAVCSDLVTRELESQWGLLCSEHSAAILVLFWHCHCLYFWRLEGQKEMNCHAELFKEGFSKWRKRWNC